MKACDYPDCDGEVVEGSTRCTFHPLQTEFCGSCKYFDRHDSDVPLGYCRRRSPRGDDGWPQVDAKTDWCGEGKKGTP